MNGSIAGIIVLIVVVGQSTWASTFAIGPVRPDWLLVLAVFFGLYGRRHEAILCGWVMGLLAGMLSIERLGIMSAAYAIIALSANVIRDAVFLKSAVTHLTVTALFGTVLYGIFAAYSIAMYGPQWDGLWHGLLVGMGVVVYSAAWAIPVSSVLLRFSALIGLHTSRYSHARLWKERARRV